MAKVQLTVKTFIPLITDHPATEKIPARWTFVRTPPYIWALADDAKVEEVYTFRSDPRTNGVTVLLTVDESSYVRESLPTVFSCFPLWFRYM